MPGILHGAPCEPKNVCEISSHSICSLDARPDFSRLADALECRFYPHLTLIAVGMIRDSCNIRENIPLAVFVSVVEAQAINCVVVLAGFDLIS